MIAVANWMTALSPINPFVRSAQFAATLKRLFTRPEMLCHYSNVKGNETRRRNWIYSAERRNKYPLTFDLKRKSKRRARRESVPACDWQPTEMTGCRRLAPNDFFFLLISSFLSLFACLFLLRFLSRFVLFLVFAPATLCWCTILGDWPYLISSNVLFIIKSFYPRITKNFMEPH